MATAWRGITTMGVIACVSTGACASRARTPGDSSAHHTSTSRRAIVLERGYRVGERARVEVGAEVAARRVVTVDGGAPRVEVRGLTTRFEAHSRVEEIDAHQFPRRVHYDVIRFESERDGNAFESLPAGARIDLTRGDNEASAVVTIDGHPATPSQREALEIALNFTSRPADHPSTDEVFGSAQPRLPGESWDVSDRPATRRFAEALGITTGLRAGARYEGITSLRGVPCIDVTMYLDGDMPASPAPANDPTSETRVTAHSQGRRRTAVDPTVPAQQVELVLLVTIDARGHIDGHDTRVQIERRTQTNAVAIPDDGR